MHHDAAGVLRRHLRSALPAAMKARDQVAVSALRTMLAALDNAESVDASTAMPADAKPSGLIAGAVVGLGSSEVPRKVLSMEEVLALVQGEIDERRAEADGATDHGLADHAERLAAEADVLGTFLPVLEGPEA